MRSMHDSRSNSSRTRHPRTVTPCPLARRSACVLLASIACLAWGQDHATRVVGEAGAHLRAGPSERYYTISNLEPGTSLRIIESTPSGMLHVAYPAEIAALVDPGHVEAIDDTAVRVTRATRLRALSASDGPAGSWRSVLTTPLRPGEQLKVLSIVRDDSGDVTGYLVAPPAGASGYISLDETIDPNAQTPTQTPTQTTTQTTTQTRPDASENTAEERTADQSTEAHLVAPSDLLEPMVPPIGSSSLASASAGDPADGSAPPPGQPKAGNLATSPPTRLLVRGPTQIKLGDSDEATGTPPSKALSPADLEAMYQNARVSKTFEEELDALLAEHTRTLDSLKDDQFNTRLRGQLQQRIEFLKMRIAFRDGPAKLAGARANTPRISERLAQRLKQLRVEKQYTMIGRLVPSRVYDGQRLPKLYRLRSADALGRTLGYVKPDDKDMSRYLDTIVGVLGEIEIGAGGAKIISPTRIDVIEDESR